MDIRCFIISQKHVFVKAIFEKTVQMTEKFRQCAGAGCNDSAGDSYKGLEGGASLKKFPPHVFNF
jgi:hypothetical protein